MLADLEFQHSVQSLLYREAYYLDTGDWDSWLGLFTDDVDYWMPAWVSESELATDPEIHLALIHCEGLEDLEDRVFRIRTEDSLASTPLPRVCHVVGNVLVLERDKGEARVSAAWTVHQHASVKGPRVYGGRYEYRLLEVEKGFVVAAKKIIFLNDAVDVPVDIYNV